MQHWADRMTRLWKEKGLKDGKWMDGWMIDDGCWMMDDG